MECGKKGGDRTTIQLGLGLGELRFGAARDDVRRYLGDPEEIAEYSYGTDNNDNWEAWYYWEDNLTAHFDSEDTYLLGSLSIRDRNCVLNGKRLIGRTAKRVLDELRRMGFDEPEVEDMSSLEKPEYELASYDSLSLYLWFDHGRLETIQWGYLFEDDDETVIWPQTGNE